MLRCGEKTENTMQVMDVELSSCSEPEWVAWQEYLAAHLQEPVENYGVVRLTAQTRTY